MMNFLPKKSLACMHLCTSTSKEEWWLNFIFYSHILLLEKTSESPLDCKKIKQVNPKRNQPWIFIGRIDTEAEAPILWSPDAKSWLIRKDPDAEKDWGQEEKGMTEDEMAEWHHRLNGHEFEQTPGVSEGQGSGVLQSTGSQRGRHNLATEQQNLQLCNQNNFLNANLSFSLYYLNI